MKTDNGLIAEFMGGRYDAMSNSWTGLPEKYHAGHMITWAYSPADLMYSSSWDWLMPVVEKIESLTLPVTGYRMVIVKIDDCTCSMQGNRYNYTRFSGESKIEAVYKAVVKFIKWYNTQNHQS
jgi:hypothetical protein